MAIDLPNVRFSASFLGVRNGRMAAAPAAVMAAAAPATMTVMAMPAAVVGMAIPIRMMVPAIAAVVTVIAPSVVPVTAEIDPKRTNTEVLRRGRPGIEKGSRGKQG